jgi:hypothetical protein
LAPNWLPLPAAKAGAEHQARPARTIVVRAHVKRAPRGSVSVFIEGDPGK